MTRKTSPGTAVLLDFLPSGAQTSSDAVFSAFMAYISEAGIVLYAAQEEAILEIMADKQVLLNTPTGSGKTLVAWSMLFKALAQGKRGFYTCPIKALVSEKFFALCKDFGPENVGMLTGDASVNPDAPLICCTAEILANMALSGLTDTSMCVVMDEFHYYSDEERGVAWQLPLLVRSSAQFLLMSATMGDTSQLEKFLADRIGRKVACIVGNERPVPLDYEYRETPMHETLADLIGQRKYPVYVVNFTQRECIEEAQNALSVNFCTKEEKQEIEKGFYGFRFDTPFGKTIKRFIAHGVGLHHAGLLPKYRLLVEKLAQSGKLKIVMGTDTLGVGVNIPIRTVLFSKLCKFDGKKVSILSVRDFKQIAGRAGRKGYDEAGSVVVQAPEHVIENKRLLNRFAADEKKNKKIVKKEAPKTNYAAWDEATFRRLIESGSESLRSQFAVSHGMMMVLFQAHLENANLGYRTLVELIGQSHETRHAKKTHRRKAKALFQSLIKASVISLSRQGGRQRIVVHETLEHDFSLHNALSLFLLHALNLLDFQDPDYPLNVLTLVESILENPKAILIKQIDKLKTLKLAEMKADGLDFEDRMVELEKIEHPKPLRDFIYTTYNAFAEHHPWLDSDNIRPKSIAREMVEKGASFNEYISEYGLDRSEGVLLRYLSWTYKIMDQTVPEQFKTEPVLEILMLLRDQLAKIDKSLIEEWENMLTGPQDQTAPQLIQRKQLDPKLIRAKLRTDLWNIIKCLAKQDPEGALEQTRRDNPNAATVSQLKDGLTHYFASHSAIWVDARARAPHLLQIDERDPKCWKVTQKLLDPQGDLDFALVGEVCVDEALSLDAPVFALQELSPI